MLDIRFKRCTVVLDDNGQYGFSGAFELTTRTRFLKRKITKEYSFGGAFNEHLGLICITSELIGLLAFKPCNSIKDIDDIIINTIEEQIENTKARR